MSATPSTAHHRGQAVVEFALVLPLLLFLILEGVQLSAIALAMSRLEFAVQQGAVAGAREPAVADRCDVAETTILAVLDRPVDQVRCSAIGELFTVSVDRHFRSLSPFHADPIYIGATESAPVVKEP